MLFITIYCPTCNRSSDDTRFIGNFCEFCIIKKLEKNVPGNVTIYQCRFCNRIREGKTFVELKNRSLAGAIEAELKLPSGWRVKVKSHDEKQVEAVFVSIYDNEKIGFSKTLELKIARETCQRCERISGGYYEAIAQLRGDWDKINNLIPKITKYVERRGGFITKVEKVEGGKDVYVSDKLMMNEFFHDYELKPTRSFRLYGMKRGKKLYRNTYSLHM